MISKIVIIIIKVKTEKKNRLREKNKISDHLY